MNRSTISRMGSCSSCFTRLTTDHSSSKSDSPNCTLSFSPLSSPNKLVLNRHEIEDQTPRDSLDFMTTPQLIQQPLTLFFLSGSRRPWSRDRTFRPSPPATFRTTAPDLIVISTDLFIKNNSETSHTDPFYANGTRSDCLILRRGEPFNLGITLSRPLSDDDILNLIFTVSGKFLITCYLPVILLKQSKLN